jgi:hypothetical protein
MSLFGNSADARDDLAQLNQNYLNFMETASISKEEIRELKQGIFDYTKTLHNDFLNMAKQMASGGPSQAQTIVSDTSKSLDQKAVDLLFLIEKNTKDMVTSLFLNNTTGSEQKTFSKDKNKEISESSTSVIDAIKSLGKDITNLADRPIKMAQDYGGSILGELLTVLAAGGLAAALAPLLAGPFVKWFDENFGTSLKKRFDDAVAPFMDLKAKVSMFGKWLTMAATSPIQMFEEVVGGFKLLGKGLVGSIELIGKSLGASFSFIRSSLANLHQLPRMIGVGLRRSFRLFVSGFGDTAKAVGSGVKTFAGGLFKGILGNALKKLPVIGALISAAQGAVKLMNGDTTGGLLNLASGLAGFIPGIGMFASLYLDILETKLDEEAGGDPNKKGNLLGKVFSDLNNTILDYIMSFFNGMVKKVKSWLGFGKVEEEKIIPRLEPKPQIQPVSNLTPQVKSVTLERDPMVLDKYIQHETQNQRVFNQTTQKTAEVVSGGMKEMSSSINGLVGNTTNIISSGSGKATTMSMIPTQRPDGVRTARDDYKRWRDMGF